MAFFDKVVLITGAGSGIGAASAIEFAKQEAKVVLVDKDEARLKKVAGKCKLGSQKPVSILCDISVEENVKKLVNTTIDICQKIDVLVNCAGVFNPTSIFHENLLQLYDEMMRVNLRGIVNLIQSAVPYLIQSKGNVINISSAVVACVPKGKNFLCYGMSKASLEYFTIDLAKEMSAHRVRVNMVSPGAVRTNIAAHLGIDNWWEEIESQSPLGRISEPEEIAEVILFIAKAKGIHGSNYEYDNGFKFMS